MFALFEGTARDPFVASRSLDTRGASPCDPQVSQACSTALLVVISLELHSRGEELADFVTSYHTPAKAFFHTPALVSVTGPEQGRLMAAQPLKSVLHWNQRDTDRPTLNPTTAC